MIAAIVTAAQVSGTLDVLDTTKVDVRSTVTCVGSCSLPTIDNGTKGILLSLDLATNPAARLHLRTKRLELNVSYSGLLTAPDAELGIHWRSGASQLNDLELLNTGAATVAWQDRYTRLSLAETASYGQLNSALLNTVTAAGGQVGTQTALAPTTITYGSTDTSASLSATVARHSKVIVSGEYFGAGPLSGFEQGVLSDQHAYRGSGSVVTVLSRTDTLSTVADASATSTWGPCAPGLVPLAPTAGANCAERDILYDLREVIHHSLSRTTTLELGAGATIFAVEAPGVDETELAADVVATWIQSLGRRDTGSLNVSVMVAPVVDYRTGLVDERLQASARLSKMLPSRVVLTLGSGWLDSVPSLTNNATVNPYPLTVVNADADAMIHLNRQLDVDVGAQTFWQVQKSFGTFFSTIAYVSVTAHAPTLDFGGHHDQKPMPYFRVP
jgi:hypothetical protein